MSNTKKSNAWQILLIVNAALLTIALTFLMLLYLDRPHIGYIEKDKVIKKYPHITGDGFKMYDPVPANVAQDGVDAFRDEHNYGDYFVTYDTMVLKDYIRIASTQIANSGRVLHADSCWQIGFYPYIRDVGIGTIHDLKVDFLAVPVMVPKGTTSTNYRDWGQRGGGIDYFKKFNNPYNKNFLIPYDFGNMHP